MYFFLIWVHSPDSPLCLSHHYGEQSFQSLCSLALELITTQPEKHQFPLIFFSLQK